jgi:proline iminopeptidase
MEVPYTLQIIMSSREYEEAYRLGKADRESLPMTKMTEERQIPIAGGQLWSVRQGNGPAVLLCHGGPGLWDYLAPVAGMIDDLATVYHYDQRGCGRSSGGPPWTMEQALDDIEALRRGWHVDDWIVIGHSFGASLALAYGLFFPHHVRGIGYVAGTGIDPAWHKAYHQEVRRRFTDEEYADLQARKQRYQQPGGPEKHTLFREYAERKWASDVADKHRASALLADMVNSPWLPNEDANRALGHDAARLMETPEMRDRLRTMHIPTWILHGEADPRPLRHAQQLAELLPKAQFVPLADCGHVPWAEQPEAFQERIRQFVAHS